MDPSGLRTLLSAHLEAAARSAGHRGIPSLCEHLGLSPPPPGAAGTKAERIRASLSATPDGRLAKVAAALASTCAAAQRNEIEEALWTTGRGPLVEKRVRRELAQDLVPAALVWNVEAFDRLLRSLFVLDDEDMFAWTGVDRSLGAEIRQHLYKNPGDWDDATYLFERLGALDCSSHRFLMFMEGLVSADVCPDENAQRKLVLALNERLGDARVELRETGTRDGYPVFSAVSTSLGSSGRPKNVIFASSEKPDLRFRDAVNNDIEIMSDPARLLVYDRPIGSTGLSWHDLQSWWTEHENITDEIEAKATLYRRLEACLPRAPITLTP